MKITIFWGVVPRSLLDTFLKMEVAQSSETNYQTSWRHITEDHNLQILCCLFTGMPAEA
jgi:hypothetical protein